MFTKNLNKKKLFMAAVAANCLMSGQVVAEEAPADGDSTKVAADSIETVVVVGAPTNTVVTPRDLEMIQANDLADVFRHTPSVSVGGSLGLAQKIYIRGMEDTLLNVTVDGAPQTGTLFHHIGRVSVEPELLKKVEVQAGAGEATSGAGAIGGAVRFETVDPQDLLEEGQNFGGILKGSYFSNSGHKTSVSAFSRLGGSWGVLASYTDIDRNNMEDGNGDEIAPTGSQQSLAFAKLSGKPTQSQRLSLSFEQRDESGELNRQLNVAPTSDSTIYSVDATRQTLVLSHKWSRSHLIQLETTLYSTDSEFIQNAYDRWGEYGGNVESIGFDVRNTSNLGSHSLTYGIDRRNDTVSSRYLDATQEMLDDWAWDPSRRSFVEKGKVLGVYVQDHWKMGDSFLLSFGLRYDDYELTQVTYGDETDSSGVSPNIGFAYSVTDTVTLTLGHARAMRGKEVSDSFTLEIEAGADSLADNLQAEEVDNTELGIEYSGDNLALKASLYQSEINDVIMDQKGEGTYYENVGTLEADGFELSAAYQWNNLYLTGSYSNSNSNLNGNDIEAYEHQGLANSSGDTLGLEVSYALTSMLEVSWNFTYVQDLNDIEVFHRIVEIGDDTQTRLIDKPGYKAHDLSLRWTPFGDDDFSVNVAIQNLFNEQYRDHASMGDYGDIEGWEGTAGLYEAGRDVRASLKYKF